ncbi:sulfate adenylyltransferase subunit CysN [Paraferrimonas sedimenticola]|uniref:Sulfate adenylyltransferase subunit 1 n=1 Tax=Paraferrimonas sedimenticola TaxID=375674 RepID=A0AA37VUH5_9GAMM|nr:sulfate adenylyltransferase subunit CysN [Paraferrimonas sedimenticola]GLP95651.1 sulfate adenylyltransferase subunit 1 [Paraferrimonas sedimenticola]
MNAQVEQQLKHLGISRYLESQQTKGLLRLLTCGSVDDGKSTLIGRLLHDSAQIFEDQLATLKADSAKMGTTGEELDLALLVDGLQAEREQGITIDVAYRYFASDKRKFIIADCPGHEQYTRNMATGASTCELAVLLIDASQGVQTQTRRHAYIAHLLGIKHLVVAVNKMDRVGYQAGHYQSVVDDFAVFAKQLGGARVSYVPVSALEGDNVVNPSANMPWYQGETLLGLLEQVDTQADLTAAPARFPVQFVQRPNSDFRGYAGTLVSGSLSLGDLVSVYPSRQSARIERIVTFEGELEQANAGQAVTLTLDKEIDISRGDVIVAEEGQPTLANHLTAELVWLSETPMVLGQVYDFKLAGRIVQAKVEGIDYQVDVNSLSKHRGETLGLNDIARVTLSLTETLAIDAFDAVPQTGSAILIDRLTNATVAAAMLVKGRLFQAEPEARAFSEFERELNALVRKHFPHWQAIDLDRLKE